MITNVTPNAKSALMETWVIIIVQFETVKNCGEINEIIRQIMLKTIKIPYCLRFLM
jgi:hypothetical protein